VECPLMMVSRRAKCDEIENGAEDKSEEDVDISAKAEHDVVDDLAGTLEFDDDVVESVNVDKQVGIVIIVEAHRIPKYRHNRRKCRRRKN
jgi:hypothetical protein